MAISKSALGTVFLVAVALAGCQSSRFGSTYSRPQPSTYQPLTPAPPVGAIEQSQLPPPGSAAGTGDASQFPEAPLAPGQAPAGNAGGTDMASAGQPEISHDALVGAWKVSAAGQTCQMFMALTKWTGGYRAASRGCPGQAADVAAWDVKGSEVVLSDSNGDTIARLYSSGNSSFSGQMSGGLPILLTR